MFRYPDKTFKQNPPAKVEYAGYTRNFSDLTRTQWDELGYNEAMQVKQEPFTAYETTWVKNDDLIYRENIVNETVDEEARAKHEATVTRAERDQRLAASDWTQLADSNLDDTAMVLWQGYRQDLRDVPEQDGFPNAVEWPEMPETE